MANPKPCCPTCGRAYRATAATMPSTDLDTSRMSQSELMAHYARIAPIEDAKFFLGLGDVDGDLACRAGQLIHVLTLQGGKHTPATKAEYKRLQQDWRAMRNAADVGFGARVAVAA